MAIFLSFSACQMVVQESGTLNDLAGTPPPGGGGGTTDYSVPQYTYVAGNHTNALEFRKNAAITVIKNNCMSCHATNSTSTSGAPREIDPSRLYDSTYWPVQGWVSPGNPDNSLMIQHLKSNTDTSTTLLTQSGSHDMPLNLTALSFSDVAAIYDWILHMNEATVHVIRIPPGNNGNTWPNGGAMNYFTITTSEVLRVYNDDSTSHEIHGDSTSPLPHGSIGIVSGTSADYMPQQVAISFEAGGTGLQYDHDFSGNNIGIKTISP